MKDEFKSEYINFENGKEIKIEIRSDETKIIRDKKDKDGKYAVYEFNVIEKDTGKSGKISLFKRDVTKMYQLVDDSTGRDNTSLIGFCFSFKRTITEVDGKTNYDLSISLVKPSVDGVVA